MSEELLVNKLLSYNKYLGISEELYLEVKENIEKYKNIDVNDLNSEYSWIPIKNTIASECRYYDPLGHNVILWTKLYKCVLTQKIGITFSYNNFIIKPFAIINKHTWKLNYIRFNEVHYLCAVCNTEGYKVTGDAKEKIRTVEQSIRFLSCEDCLIKNIIE